MEREPRGTPIAGSKLLRDYCSCCGEPMRVTSIDGGPRCCLDCKSDGKSGSMRAEGMRTIGQSYGMRYTRS